MLPPQSGSLFSQVFQVSGITHPETPVANFSTALTRKNLSSRAGDLVVLVFQAHCLILRRLLRGCRCLVLRLRSDRWFRSLLHLI